ncbi:glycosyltransferase family 2 protein [Arcticibacter sp. MXS-1]|uniref:glycosyltransferase family 2 protein n=1 Tax=Arcticibacter sp. MXS-1 TaxID=3341726 RepID=UPI0035A8D2A7
MTVSVIIPTFERPELLRTTLESVWNQTVLPDEIIIGDDSRDDRTEKLMRDTLLSLSPVPIKYFHHVPSLREVKNVDFQYQQAQGDLVLHLHDDDPIYPRCLEVLKKPFEDHPEIIASFGLQRMIDEAGNLTEGAEKVNEAFFRTPDREGIVDGFLAGAVSMFPNNGFLVRRDAVLSIGYSDHGRAGKATDFYFGLRLGQLGKPFYFVNDYTAMCRIVAESQSRTATADNAYRTVKILFEDCSSAIKSYPELEKSIRDRIPIAITLAAKLKDRKTAVQWMFSKYYRSRLLTPRGVKRMLLTLSPF